MTVQFSATVQCFHETDDDATQFLVERGGRLVGEDEFGRLTSARATATRCRCPPDSAADLWSTRAPSPSRWRTATPHERI